MRGIRTATQFWSKGEEAILDFGAKHYAGCKLDTARTAQEDVKLRGVSVRATGNEPRWTLDIEKGRWLRFVGDYGGSSAYLPAQTTTIDGDKTIYRAKSVAHDLHVVVERTGCADSMSGKNFDAKVTVTADGKVYRGCGQAVE